MKIKKDSALYKLVLGSYFGIDVLSPTIIVLDEPSSNLDHRAIRRLKNILEEWKKQGKKLPI